MRGGWAYVEAHGRTECTVCGEAAHHVLERVVPSTERQATVCARCVVELAMATRQAYNENPELRALVEQGAKSALTQVASERLAGVFVDALGLDKLF